MRLLHRPIRAGAVAVLGLAMTAATGSLAATTAMAAPTSAPTFSTLKSSLPATTDQVTGSYSSSRMSIEISLAPRNAASLSRELKAAYSPHSGAYHHWLAKGQFDARYAPSAAERNAVATYLRGAGLKVGTSSSPFLVRATGSSQRVAAAFRTRLSTFRDKKGLTYHANSTAVHLPTSLTSSILGVVGLSNTAREHSMVSHPTGTARPAKAASGATTSCETGYPTVAQAVQLFVDGDNVPFGYGGGPGCSGLTPSQDNSIYGAPNVGPRGKGAGVNIAVFELSEYQHADVNTWAHTFYGNGYTPPLVDVNVDGGPLNPACPTGDQCPPAFNGFAGDVEVDADIEMQLALSPDVHNLIVYNAPNDFTGQTELDEYTAIANADTASSISSSWAVCENDAGAAIVQSENVVFEQMAMQGQSMFGAEGDTGAFSCIRSDGTTIPNVLDPPSQPWVTSVGGTSLESDNPGTNPKPAYPARGTETVWNVDNLCSTSAVSAGGQSGFFWCAAGGAGGGGSSEFWGRPFYQIARGVNNPNTTHANGTTQCQLAATGTPCREDPDISANADEFTPYAEVCTANANTPNSQCGFSSGDLAPGWFGIGGTSLSSPLWSAIVADRDSFQGRRSGNINPVLYLLDNLAPSLYFHDITGVGQSTNNNGLFPTTPGYDEATGLGTPKMAELIALSL